MTADDSLQFQFSVGDLVRLPSAGSTHKVSGTEYPLKGKGRVVDRRIVNGPLHDGPTKEYTVLDCDYGIERMYQERSLNGWKGD